MRPEQKSYWLLGVTRSRAKMLEYGVPEEHQIRMKQDPARLFTISIGLLGDLAAAINRNEPGPNSLAVLKKNLLFSARFFDSYLQSKLNETLNPYFLLLGSASYYLCDLPGSASVLARRINGGCPDLGCYGLENLLLRLLQANPENHLEGSEGPFCEFIDEISKKFVQFSSEGTGEDELLGFASDLRSRVYEFGTSRQLLFGDVIMAILRKKLDNSVWNALPSYSGLPRETWLHVLQKKSFIKELWPAQHLLGKADVLKGKSAIVQMPTSAGKTKATELILRSAFLANRLSLAIIIAPFRALCHEIKNSLVEAFHNEPIKVDELSDALQTDFEAAELLVHRQILVVTPEKLLYVLRNTPELAASVGLLIFDEGHQFDNGARGITYELLLTSLRSMIIEGTQKVLISAVISNAEAVGEWLNGEPNVVEGATLSPTFRSVGFVSWLDQLGRIEYVNSQDVEENEFFVPRVIERFNLGRKKGEHNDRFFPEQALKSNGKPNPNFGKTIALYLGMKLVPNGSVAVFCGRKSTAASLCDKALDIIERGYSLALPSGFSNSQEIERQTYLHNENLGADAPASQSASHGIFSHHSNTPHGIRLALEYAIRENLVRFVICTSTLAQGVNLPIRYLIVTSIYQGLERIKVRDFHNLIGRAGRAGMHTEGSILFADPLIYDKRNSLYSKWRWVQVKELLEPGNSEPCESNLLSLFEPIKSEDGRYIITMEALDFAKTYISDPDEITKLTNDIIVHQGDKGFSLDGVERQVSLKIDLICAVESFLLSHLDETKDGISETDVIRLAEGTFAFFLANDQKKDYIRELFQLLAENISAKINDPIRRKTYGRTLYGVQDAQAIEEWVQSNADNLLQIVDETDILDITWPLLAQHIKGGVFRRFNKPEVLREIAHEWIGGKPFGDLLKTIRKNKTKMTWGSREREIKIDDVVNLCEGTIAYDGALLIGALCELIGTLKHGDNRVLVDLFRLFQKRLKYGLPTVATVVLYELGFSDRVIAQDLAFSLNLTTGDKRELIRSIKDNIDEMATTLDKYPKYYQDVLIRNTG